MSILPPNKSILSPDKSDSACAALMTWFSPQRDPIRFLDRGFMVKVTPRGKGWCVTTSGHIRAGKFSLVPNPAPDGPLHADSTYTLVRI